MLSIVIPTLNAARTLPATLAALALDRAGLVAEVILVDGGSTDDTRLIATSYPVIVVEAARGRGSQLAAGAEAAAGEWLLFLHADTQLDAGWAGAVADFVGRFDNQHRAGYFRFALDDRAFPARLLERMVRLRNRWFGLRYGDQGLLISRQFYEEVGGYRRLPLMEDVDLARRIGKRRLSRIKVKAISSAERYRTDGYVPRSLRNVLCLALYSVGVPPRRLLGIYR